MAIILTLPENGQKNCGFCSRNELVLENLSWLKFITRKFLNGSLDPAISEDDLINEGALGLIDAAKKFNSLKGKRFRTYAEIRVRGAIRDFLRKSGPVRLPRSFFQEATVLRKKANDLRLSFGREPERSELARALGWNQEKIEEVSASIERKTFFRYEADDLFFDQHQETPENNGHEDLKKFIFQMMDSSGRFSEKEIKCFNHYFFGCLTLAETGKIIGIAESNVAKKIRKAKAFLKKETNLSALKEFLLEG